MGFKWDLRVFYGEFMVNCAPGRIGGGKRDFLVSSWDFMGFYQPWWIMEV